MSSTQENGASPTPQNFILRLQRVKGNRSESNSSPAHISSAGLSSQSPSIPYIRVLEPKKRLSSLADYTIPKRARVVEPASSPVDELPTIQKGEVENDGSIESKKEIVRKSRSPLAIGLHSDQPAIVEDYFYREVLVSGGSMKRRAQCYGEDVEVEERKPRAKEAENREKASVQTLKLRVCARSIFNLFDGNNGAMHKMKVDDSISIEELRERASIEPSEVAEHLTILLKFIPLQRLAMLTNDSGDSMFHTMSLHIANRLQESLHLVNKKRISSMQSAHVWLVERLPPSLLASYIDLMGFSRHIGSPMDKIILVSSEDPRMYEANRMMREFLSTSLIDHPTKEISSMSDCNQPMRNVSFLLVYPPQFAKRNGDILPQPCASIFRQLSQVVQCVEKVDLNRECGVYKVSAEKLTQKLLRAVETPLRHMVNRRPNDHIFVVGWGTSCLINHRALLSVSGVSGVIDFAFPSESAAGPRGDVEDEICLTYCPTLLVVGESASDVRMTSIRRIRANMIVESGLMIVGGGADQNLCVSPLRLSVEQLSQQCVERNIVENTIEFVKKVAWDLGVPSPQLHATLKPIEVVLNTTSKTTTPSTSRPRASTSPIVFEKPMGEKISPATNMKRDVRKEEEEAAAAIISLMNI